jgi:hypothetical protein
MCCNKSPTERRQIISPQRTIGTLEREAEKVLRRKKKNTVLLGQS